MLPAGSLVAEFFGLHATDRQDRVCIIPQAVNTV